MAARRLGVSWLRHHPDPATSADPRVRELVGQLGQLPLAPPMRDGFRADLRAQLVAVTPRLVAEGVSAPPPKQPAGRVPRRGARRLGRPLAVLATAAAVLVGLLAGAVWFSGRTLPGDSLYGLKRANENVQLSLTSGDVARGKAYLDLAKTRAEESVKLWNREGVGKTAAQIDGSRTASLITGALSDGDTDTADGAQLLTGYAVHNRDAGPLDTISDWAPQQVQRLQALLGGVPAGSLHDRIATSVHLAQRLAARATQLRAQLGCGCLTSTSSDDLGPLPCTSCAATPTPATPGHGSTPGTGPGGTSAPGTGSQRTGSPPTTPANGGHTAGVTPHGGGTGVAARPASRTTAASERTGAIIPGVGAAGSVLPGVSAPPAAPASSADAAAPVTTGSCGVQAGIGPIGLGVGSCGLSVGVGR